MTEAEHKAQQALGLTVQIPIWMVLVDTRHGPVMRVFRIEAEATDFLWDWVQENWRDDDPPDWDKERSMVEKDEIIDDFFTSSMNDSYTVERQFIEVAVSEVLK